MKSCSRIAILLPLVLILVSTTLTVAQPVPGDLIVASRQHGSVYAIDPDTGDIRDLLSGLELRDQLGTVKGTGVSLAGSYQTGIDIGLDGRVLARFAGPGGWGLISMHAFTGDRMLLPDTDGALWDASGCLMVMDDGTVITVANDWNSGADSDGRILRYDPVTGSTTVITGGGIGDGPMLKIPNAIALLDANTLIVAEWKWNFVAGAGLYKIDIPTGDRTFLCHLSCAHPFERPLIVEGEVSGTVSLEGGTGPVSNAQCRTMIVMNGRIFVGEAIQLPGGGWNGGILEVDPMTGDRSLVVGYALEDDGVCQTPIVELPAGWGDIWLDGPMGFTQTQASRFAFVCLFGPNQVFEYDINTQELGVLSTLDGQIDPSFQADLRLSGLAVYRASQLAGDLNCDGNVDGSDIGPFPLALLDPAEYEAAYPHCDACNADFDDDDVVSLSDVPFFVDCVLNAN